MPRKSRKQLVGAVEDIERREREQAYRELQNELHLEWATTRSSGVSLEVSTYPSVLCNQQI